MQAPSNPITDTSNKFDLLPKNLDHQVILRAAFGVHFLFTSLVYLSAWTPNVYAYYNGFLIAGFWIASTTIHIDLALLKLMAMEAASSLLDIFVIAIYYNKSSKEGLDFYCFLAFVVQLLARFGAMLGIHRIRKERRNAGIRPSDNPSFSRMDYQQVQSSSVQQPSEHVGYDYQVPTKMEPLPNFAQGFTQGYHQ